MKKNLHLQLDYLKFLREFGLNQPSSRPGMERIADILRSKRDVFKEAARRGSESWIDQEGHQLMDQTLEWFSDEDHQEFWASMGVAGDHGPLDLYVNILQKSLPSVHVARLDSIYFGEFPTGDFNAHARRTDHGYLCLIHGGLRRFLFQISMVAVMLLPDTSSETSAQSPGLLLIVASGIYAAVATYFGDPADPPQFPDSRTKFQYEVCGHMVSTMKHFVTAHEVGHVICGHLDGGESRLISIRGHVLEVVRKSYEQEFEADLFAQEALALADQQRENLFGDSWSFMAGGVCFLLASQILEVAASKLSTDSKEPSGTHPPDTERIDRLLTFINKHRFKMSKEDAAVTRVLMDCMGGLLNLTKTAIVERDATGLKIGLPDEILS